MFNLTANKMYSGQNISRHVSEAFLLCRYTKHRFLEVSWKNSRFKERNGIDPSLEQLQHYARVEKGDRSHLVSVTRPLCREEAGREEAEK
jgi:hypothetical protein